MEQQPEAPLPEKSSTQMSLSARILNIFSSPGEVFSGMIGAPKSSGNWLVPLLLGILVSTATIFIVFSRPTIQQQMMDTQHQQFEKQVQAGKMTQEQVDRAEEFSRPGSTMFTIFGVVGAALVTIVAFLIVALVYWLLGKFAFKAQIGYGISLEAVGLSYMVMVLGTIISILTILALDSLHATPSLALLVKEFDINNSVHKLLSQVNIFSIWFVALLGIGLAKMSGSGTMKTMPWVFGIFIVFAVVVSFVF